MKLKIYFNNNICISLEQQSQGELDFFEKWFHSLFQKLFGCSINICDPKTGIRYTMKHNNIDYYTVEGKDWERNE